MSLGGAYLNTSAKKMAGSLELKLNIMAKFNSLSYINCQFNPIYISSKKRSTINTKHYIKVNLQTDVNSCDLLYLLYNERNFTI